MLSNNKGKEKFTRRTKQSPRKNKKTTASRPNNIDLQRQQICDMAARIVQEDGIRDFHKAKLRACDALHIKSNTFLPTNEEIEFALKQRINLFDSNSTSVEQTQQLAIAVDMLTILADYHPRLTGSLLCGLALKKSPIEIHLFSNSVELVNDELNWRGITNFNVEKRYRFSNNEYLKVPLVICQLDNIDIEISVFEEKALHRIPICPTNGRVYARQSLKEVSVSFNLDMSLTSS